MSRATQPPAHYPAGSPDGPWGVDTIGRHWCVIHRETLRAKAIGPVWQPRAKQRINYLDRAHEEAHRRNTAPT